jgi:antitoxin CptB
MSQEVSSTANLSRMRWHCRRGMRELDVLLTRYFEEVYPSATLQHQQAFADLLDLQDPLIMAYVTGKQTPDSKEIADVIQQFTHLSA